MNASKWLGKGKSENIRWLVLGEYWVQRWKAPKMTNIYICKVKCKALAYVEEFIVSLLQPITALIE